METLSPSELVKIFPEALPIIKRNLRIYRKQLKSIVMPLADELFDAWLIAIYSGNDPSFDTDKAADWLNNFIYKKERWNILDDNRIFRGPAWYEKHIKRLKLLEKLYMLKDKPLPAGEISHADIQLAKQVPITNYLEKQRNGFARCIFHHEKTGSMKIYKDNHFHCFGCGKTGDVIAIVMQVAGCGFLDAVRKILGK